MDLSQMVVKSKTVEMEYPGLPDVFFSIAYLTRDELMNLRKKATNQKFNRKTRQPEEEVDNELFQDIYIQAVIKGWKGFKYNHLSKMIPMDFSGLPEETYKGGEGAVEFNKSNATILMKNSTDFDSWVSEQLADVENFTQTN